jgi:hypothetical protein
LAAQLVATRAELATLQERYDALREDRDRLAQTLGEKLKTWKRFKQWIFISKTEIPPKAMRQLADLGAQGVGSSTPGSQQQQQHGVKMLETPISPKSLSLIFSRERVNANLTSRTSLDSRGRSTLPNRICEPTKKPPFAQQTHP